MSELNVMYTPSNGVFALEYRYFQDGSKHESAGNERVPFEMYKAMNARCASIVFRFAYRNERGCKRKISNISIITPSPYYNVYKLPLKVVSRHKLDTKKTWFVTAPSSDSFGSGAFLAIVGFRRVPRKWVPEMNALLVPFPVRS